MIVTRIDDVIVVAPADTVRSHRIGLVLVGLLLLVGPLLFHATGFARSDDLNPDLKGVLGIPADMHPEFLRLATKPNRHYNETQVLSNGPNTIALDVAHIGGDRLLFKVVFGHPVRFDDGSLFHFYLDLDNDRETGRQGSTLHNGVDIMITLRHDNISISSHNEAYSRRQVFAGGTIVDDTLYLLVEAPLHGDDDDIYFTAHTTAQRHFGDQRVGRSETTDRVLAKLPRQHVQELPPFDRYALASLAPLSDFRYIDDYVKYESLSNKGLSYDLVANEKDDLFGRERPSPSFIRESPLSGREGSVAKRRIPFTIAEEYGVERRRVPATFGFPLPAGAVYDLDHIRILSSTEAEIPAQFTATSLWPDDSLKWVLVDFTDDLKPHEERSYSVEFGHDVRRASEDRRTGVMVDEDEEKIVITTGPMQVRVGKRSFRLFDDVRVDTNGDGIFTERERIARSGPEGIGLIDEHGRLYTTSARRPQSFQIEEKGPEKVVLRVEGRYGSDDGADYMTYVTRLTFRARSTRVHVAHTHINDELRTEFTDFTSLYLPIDMEQPIDEAYVFTNDVGDGLEAHGGRNSAIRLFLKDERTAWVDDEPVVERPYWTAGLVPGVARVSGGEKTVTAVIHEFQERWPKGIHAEGSRLSLELLPEQPDDAYGTDLPYHLMFPFVSGKYRLKWGNSFTERITIDFGSEGTVEEMAAEGQVPVVAVIPSEWYDETKVFGPIATITGDRMALWDRFVSESYIENLRAKIAAREYGFLNYGDWFGERERNWGNNEYDLAHGFFMEFVRTGDRRYYRLALAAARHQADVDLIHAYPDPTFVGANARHSVGHTGEWTERANHATWSRAYDSSFMASNGHTWADGMVDAWFLSGDARVMEGALSLGEHIAWSMAPSFTELGTHERSAGWSLKAMMALYRATYDPIYLEAAQRIVSVALREQDLHGSGAWPHPLPTDHSGNRLGTVGNNLYLIGILLGGLQSYHMETGDPDVLRSIEAGVDWMLQSWNPERGGWPYSAAVDGEPLYVENANLNPIITSAMAYAASLRDDAELFHVVAAAMDAHLRTGTKNDGKSIGMTLHFASGILAALSELPQWVRSEFVMVDAPLDGQRVSGRFPIELRLLSPEDEDQIQRMEVTLDGVPVYSSSSFPKAGMVVVDSEGLDDGRVTVDVTVEHAALGLWHHSIKVTIDNRWSLVQPMTPPTSSGWFGEIDYLETDDRSSGWTYDTSDPELFFGDRHRLVRDSDESEYLIWKTPRLKRFELVLYVKPEVDLERGLHIAVSGDGSDWHSYQYDAKVAGASAEWNRIAITGFADDQFEWNWFRLIMTEGVSHQSIQIGNASFEGLREL